jgi:2-phosphosulfolactate phosphatase
MLVEVIGTVHEANHHQLHQKTVIVVDVLRATSTIITALAHGCHTVIPATTVEEALLFKQSMNINNRECLLGGERCGQRIAGFDLGNSPLEYRTTDIAHRTIVMTTTNGTRAIQSASPAAHVLAGAFINSLACAEVASALQRDVVILCAGTDDAFSLEDGLCAGCIIEQLKVICGIPSIILNDLGIAMQVSYQNCKPLLEAYMLMSSNGKNLVALGCEADLAYCAQLNVISTVPILTCQGMQHFNPSLINDESIQEA